MLKNQSAKFEDSPQNLGGSLRARRKQLGLTMQSVADAAGLSVGFISQVERGLTSPSLSSLASLADVLQTHISAFLDQPKPDGRTTRTANRESYSVAGAPVSYERLSTTFDGSQLHSVIVNAPPGHRAEPISHRGEEMFFMLEGELTVEIEGSVEILRQGDSTHFDSRRIHSTWNHTNNPASMIWSGTMDIFGDAPDPIHKETSVKNINKKTFKKKMARKLKSNSIAEK